LTVEPSTYEHDNPPTTKTLRRLFFIDDHG
jgi:hypothetical protein